VIDSRTIELMNLEVDGVLDAAGREELRVVLAADPRARQMFDDLRRLAHLLDTAIAVDPPAGLHAQVARQVAGSKVLAFATPPRSRRFLPLKIAAAFG
jgi:anti-sigma factor RsiW